LLIRLRIADARRQGELRERLQPDRTAMTRDTGLATIPGRPHPEASRRLGGALREDVGEAPLAAGAARCADAARTRGEPIGASAVPYRRYLLLEAPGPWGCALDEKRLDAGLAPLFDRASAAAGLNVLLIRRPGRHRAVTDRRADRPRAWAIADTSARAERVLWGTWSSPDDLLSLDLTVPLPAAAAHSGPQKVVLTCTNGKRDLCCAVRGRPVAEALATVDGWDCWESSHLGGHRFAATVMLLPTGDMFGWLDPGTAVTAVERFDAGQLLLPHYRGRAGQPFPAQAALHAARARLGDARRGAFTVSAASRVPAVGQAGSPQALTERWEVLVSHRPGPGATARAYQVTVAGATSSPALLSCGDDRPQAEVRYTAIAFSRVRR
jgi:hypothetical protein